MGEGAMTVDTGFIALARSPGVVISSLKVALVVGSILALINHGPEILEFRLTGGALVQVALTYLVPYSVSTYSSVRALQRHAALHAE